MSDIVERLRKVESGDKWDPGDGLHVTHWYRNPDGPEAADLIERQRAVIEELKKRAEIDRQQCDDMTDEAGKLAMENKNQRAVIEAARRLGKDDVAWENFQKALRVLDGGDDE